MLLRATSNISELLVSINSCHNSPWWNVTFCCVFAGEQRITLCRSPKSGANFFSLGNFEEQLAAAYARAQPAIDTARSNRQAAPVASLLPLFAWMKAPVVAA